MGNPLESNRRGHPAGGSVIFEQKDGATLFKGYQPSFQVNDCIIVARNEKQDRLICITGHLGQGHLESGSGKRSSESNRIPPRGPSLPARRLAVNHFETTASDTLGPSDCYFCRSVHNGAGRKRGVEHR
jgi:hypothetical protein